MSQGERKAGSSLPSRAFFLVGPTYHSAQTTRHSYEEQRFYFSCFDIDDDATPSAKCKKGNFISHEYPNDPFTRVFAESLVGLGFL